MTRHFHIYRAAEVPLGSGRIVRYEMVEGRMFRSRHTANRVSLSYHVFGARAMVRQCRSEHCASVDAWGRTYQD